VEPLGELAATLDCRSENRRRFVRGTAAIDVRQDCQRCLETLARRLTVDFDVELLSEERLARRLAADDPPQEVYMISDGVLDSLALLEDELLLAIESRPCQAEPCENMPAMSFGPGTSVPEPAQASEVADDRQKPFEGLKDLLAAQKGDDGTDQNSP
jgi:uncharacterized metal-binding protein YceD (DUF177 family)